MLEVWVVGLRATLGCLLTPWCLPSAYTLPCVSLQPGGMGTGGAGGLPLLSHWERLDCMAQIAEPSLFWLWLTSSWVDV